MAFEKYWKQIPAVPFTADGRDNGEVTVNDACQFKVGQIVVLKSATESDLRAKIKRIPSYNKIILGPWEGKGRGNIKARMDVSAYLLADIATIRAEEQLRPSIPKKDMDQATFEEEPTIAWRSFLVDKCGNGYTKDNRFPVEGTFNADISYSNKEGLTVLSIPTKQTEVSFTFPNGLQYYRIRIRGHKDVLKIGLAAGDIAAGNYKTVSYGNTFEPDVLNDFPNNYTLYFETKHKNNMKLEIEYWYFV